MKLSLIQSPIVWENISANLEYFSNKIALCPSSGIIILPEMFTTGFSLDVKHLAETMDGPTLNWLKSQARSKDALIIGSIIIKENGKYYNRCIAMFPNGDYHFYDKKHLFTYGNEHSVYSAGTSNTSFVYKGWNIKLLICYDLRFPVWSRNTENYDLLIYVASWPITRINAWKQLLVARAIENQSYVVGVNRIGKDGNNLLYNGNSAVIDFMGNTLCTSEEETILTQTINRDNCTSYRKDFPFLNDKVDFSISSL